jgi:gamma-glutamyltranspeptidase / glutathione hydrolase
VRQAIHGTYRGYDIYASPPPSGGGICLVLMLNILENFQLDKPASALTRHLMIESMRRAYCDRARYLGDPGFTAIPPHLTSKEYAKQLAGQIDLKKATRSEDVAPEIALAAESDSTTHFSVIDASGMAVSNTYTLENSYGSRVVVRGAGFLLNNEMTDFNRIPGHTDRSGRIGTPANLIAAGKRMLSSQTPVLVLRDGRLRIVTGSPGGRTITNTVLCTLTNVIDQGMDIRQAVDAPRMHHQWFPDKVKFEGVRQPGYQAEVETLRKMGHVFDERAAKQGDAHSIFVDPQTGRYFGAADHRIDGKAASY